MSESKPLSLVPLDDNEKALIVLLIQGKLAKHPDGAAYRAYEAILTKMNKEWTSKPS